MGGKKFKRPDLFERLTPERKGDKAVQTPATTDDEEELFPNIPQFEREDGAHNRDRRSGWRADEHADSLENDEEEEDKP